MLEGYSNNGLAKKNSPSDYGTPIILYLILKYFPIKSNSL